MGRIEIVIASRVEEHLGKHNIDRRELLQVLCHPYFIKRSGKRFVLYGKTNSGRYLTAILEKVKGTLFFLVTARNSTKSEKALYREKTR